MMFIFSTWNRMFSITSVQFSHSVVSSSLWPNRLQHARLPCPSPTPGACSNSCPSRRWCHPTSHPLSSPSPPAFNLSQHQSLFQWAGSLHQVAKVLASASASVLPVNIQDWCPLRWIVLISLLSKGLSRVFSSTTVWSHHKFCQRRGYIWVIQETIL